jgi:hypothetical protein
VEPEAGATDTGNERQAAKRLEKAVNKLYLEGDVAGLTALAAEAATLAERSDGATRRRALSTTTTPANHALLASRRPPPQVHTPGFTRGLGAVLGGVTGFVVGLVAVSASGGGGDIASLNALADVFGGVIGLVFGAVTGLVVGAVVNEWRADAS